MNNGKRDKEVEQKIYWAYEKGSSNLYLDNLQIHTLPDDITDLDNLQSLYIRGNYLRELPEEIGQLKNLTKLYLDNNSINYLPDSIVNLSQLEVLFLNNNELMSLPNNFGNLNKLERLSLTGNNLEEIPESLVELVELKQLYLNNNKLIQLPDMPLLLGLEKLVTLDLSNNPLLGNNSRRFEKKELAEYSDKIRRQKEIYRKSERDNEVYTKILKTIQQVRENIPLTLNRLAELSNTDRNNAEIKIQTILDTQPDLGEYLSMEQVFIKSTQITEKTISAFSGQAVDVLQICQNCGDKQSVLINQCRNCGADLDFCKLCKKGFTAKDVKNSCPSCKNNFHKSHLIAYIQSMGKCPVCKEQMNLKSPN